MWIFLFFCLIFFTLFFAGYIFFNTLKKRLDRFEGKIILEFSSRNDSICQLYEILKTQVTRHDDIFKEALELRKKEFSLLNMSSNMESFMMLQASLHHEINFIFQISLKNPKLIKNKKFLYIRDIMLEKSADIKKSIGIYNQLIVFYNKLISLKNITIIGLFISAHKKLPI